MSFSVNTRKVDSAVVVDISGQLTGGEPVLLLRNTVRRFIEDGNVKFVFNLADVSYIDSAGLGELVTSYTTIRNRQGDVKLLKISAVARHLLQLTKLLTVFDTYEDEQKAVSSLTSSAAHG
jgi:anti-sigma B factor antagonist